MKLSPLLLTPALALETSSTAKSLLAAVGHRNVSHMEALVQGLADESVSVPAWKFDEDIRTALDAIRKIFVGNIQTALNEQHKVDQELLNCQTDGCFMGCINTYKKASGACQDLDKECDAAQTAHETCRITVHKSYIAMAQSCGALHCFTNTQKPPVCPIENCLCPDLSVCHTKGSYDPECVARIGSCKGQYGSWLSGMIAHYTSLYAEWQKLHGACKESYHHFLRVDMACDAEQKKFEACKCKQVSCAERSCSVEFEQCETACWKSYEDRVKDTECLEKDRKIDWSATKKIECYVDILLHEYSKEELLTKCGSETCVNVAREEDYKHCHTICLEVDHEGEWPDVHSVSFQCNAPEVPYPDASASQTAWISGHDHRGHHDQYHLGDGHYKCDANGAEVFTRHRGGAVDRAGEKRCTEHLDIDYQVPPCCPCDPDPDPVCDEKFHAKYYCDFDDVSQIGEIHDCCPEDCGATCFTDVQLRSARNDKLECTMTFNTLTISEHSHAWAYNRCPCTDCGPVPPAYPTRPDRHKCGSGAHTFTRQAGY